MTGGVQAKVQLDVNMKQINKTLQKLLNCFWPLLCVVVARSAAVTCRSRAGRCSSQFPKSPWLGHGSWKSEREGGARYSDMAMANAVSVDHVSVIFLRFCVEIQCPVLTLIRCNKYSRSLQ